MVTTSLCAHVCCQQESCRVPPDGETMQHHHSLNCWMVLFPHLFLKKFYLSLVVNTFIDNTDDINR